MNAKKTLSARTKIKPNYITLQDVKERLGIKTWSLKRLRKARPELFPVAASVGRKLYFKAGDIKRTGIILRRERKAVGSTVADRLLDRVTEFSNQLEKNRGAKAR